MGDSKLDTDTTNARLLSESMTELRRRAENTLLAVEGHQSLAVTNEAIRAIREAHERIIRFAGEDAT